MVQAKKVAIYIRVSTDDQSTERQLNDLMAYAERADYEVVKVFNETASGMKNDRAERKKLLAMARKREIQAILVTELTRWGRSTEDLLNTMQELASYNVSLIAQTGLDFDLSTPQGKLMLTIMAGISEFERDLIRERVKSGLATAKANGKSLGRQVGQNPSDKYAEKVLKHLNDGRTVRWIAHEMQISKTTVMAIKKRA